MLFEAGQVVFAKAGREKGGFYLIISIEDDCAFIADGRRRSVEKPKKKKLIHIAATKTFMQPQSEYTNREIRRILHPFNYGEAGIPD